MLNKKIIILAIFLVSLFAIGAVSAVDNITVDGDSVIDGEVEMPTERLEIKFNDDDETLTYNVFDERIYSGLTENLNYDYKVNNRTCAGGQGLISNPTDTKYANTLKYYEDGEHNLIIHRNNHGTKTLLFDVTFNVKNNVSLSDDITIQNNKTVKYSIKNGVISGSFPETSRTLHEGWNNLTEYSLLNTGLGSTKPVILKVYYRPYIINNTDIRTLTEIEEQQIPDDNYEENNDYDDNQKIEIRANDIDFYYSTTYSYIVSLVDYYGYPVSDAEELKVIYDDGEEEIGEYDEEEEGQYLFSMDTIANRKATFILTDSYYKADPVTINVKISKSPVKITTKAYYSNTKQYSILKATVKDDDGEPIYEGKVKFNVNGKSYYVNVEDGVATKKIKLTKAKTYTYSATYIGNDHYKGSKTSSSKIYVYSSSKTARTISIKGYKVTLTQNQYNKLINAKNTGKTFVYKLNTGKTIKQKVDVINKKTYKTTTKTVTSKIYIYICFDGSGKYTGSLPANQYVAELTTSNQNRFGNIICHKWLFGYKQSKVFPKLNSAKVRQTLTGL